MRAAHFNPWTGAFVHAEEPIALYLIEETGFPSAAYNILSKLRTTPEVGWEYGWKELFRWCADSRDADFLVFPIDLNYFEGREVEVLEQLPDYAAAPHRYLFVDHRDSVSLPFDPRSVYLKVSVPANPKGRVMSLPQLEGVDDLLPFMLAPEPPQEFDLFFIGQTSPYREAVLQATRTLSCRAHLECTDSFFFGPYMRNVAVSERQRWEDTRWERAARRLRYIDLMRRSRFVMAIRGYGTNSFRFFEALSLGVPPILVTDSCELPLRDLVPYDEICVVVHSDDGTDVAERLADVTRIPEERRRWMARQGRHIYDTYLSKRSFLLHLHRFLRADAKRRP